MVALYKSNFWDTLKNEFSGYVQSQRSKSILSLDNFANLAPIQMYQPQTRDYKCFLMDWILTLNGRVVLVGNSMRQPWRQFKSSTPLNSLMLEGCDSIVTEQPLVSDRDPCRLDIPEDLVL